MKKKYDTLPIEANEAILNIITHMGLEFKRNSMYAGENIGKLYGIIKYPPEVNIGWLSKINNMPGTIVCQTFTPTDNSELIQNISSTIRQKTGEAESARDPLVRQRAMKAVEQGENIMKQIDQNGETVGYVSNIIMVTSSDDEQFRQRCRQAETTIASVKCKARGLANLQKNAYKAISPYHVPDDKIENVCKKLHPHIRTGEAIILQKMYQAVWLPLIRGCVTVTEQTQIGLSWALPDRVSLRPQSILSQRNMQREQRLS